MLTRPFDLVIVLSDSRDVLERIRYAGKPYIYPTHTSPEFGKGCRGVVRLRHKKSIETIAREARGFGVRSIWCVDFQVTHRYVAEMFRRKGFDVSFLSTGCDGAARSLSDAVQESATTAGTAPSSNWNSASTLAVRRFHVPFCALIDESLVDFARKSATIEA